METSIQFIKKGYDGFFDFLKAYCIICVILAHNSPSHEAVAFSIWGGMQVPLFLLIQTFHALKKGNATNNWRKILLRLILPFIIVEGILFIILLLKTDGTYPEIFSVIKSFIIGGGYGPGSYYIWIYLQFAIILSVMAPIFRNWSRKNLLLLFVVISIMGEVFCSLTQMHNAIYRILSIRYLFLIYLGYIWVKDGIVINRLTLLLSILSLGTILFFTYTDYNLEPLIFHTQWKVHHWICYFYAANLLTFLIYQLYLLLKKTKLNPILLFIGRASWEIFLTQIFIFVVLPKDTFSFISSVPLLNFCYIFLTLTLSITTGALLHIFIHRLHNPIENTPSKKEIENL